MLVTVAAGAGRLVLPALVLLLAPVVSPAHQSPAKHHPANIVRLLNTPEHKLDDAAIWEVAAFLSNYTRPSEDDAKALEITMKEYMSGSGKSKSQVISRKIVPIKQPDPKPGQLKITIEQVTPKPHKTTKHPSFPDPAGMAPDQKRDEKGEDGKDGGKDGHKKKSNKRPPRSAEDRFYFLHHMRPDLPALDRVLAEEPPEEDQEPEPTSTTRTPTPRPPPPGAISDDLKLQMLLRAMVVYEEAAEGDEGTLSAVQRLIDEGVAKVELPKFGKKLSKIVEDQSMSKTRRRRSALRPDMSRFTDLMGRERYSQELINSFQPGGKKYPSIKKELREPIDIDIAGVAVMSASLRKRSAPESGPTPVVADSVSDELFASDEVDGVSIDLSQRTVRSDGADLSAISDASQQASAAIYDKQLDGARPRPARSVAGTRRVLDEIRIAPELPDLMDLDPEDVLEPDMNPLLPVMVSSGDEDPLAITEHAALVFEDTGQRETWSQWGLWGPCSVTCGPGQKARYRHCVQGPRCQPGERQADFKPCFRKSCTLPVPDGLVDAFR